MKQIIPAQPGWFTIEPIYDDPKQVIAAFENPIIAWVIDLTADDEDMFPLPVTMEGVQGGDDKLFLKRPDGVVEKPFDRAWADTEEWVRWKNGEEE